MVYVVFRTKSNENGGGGVVCLDFLILFFLLKSC